MQYSLKKIKINQPSCEISEDCLHRKQGASRRSGFSFPASASHTAYPATFGTSFSLLGFSHLGHWHKINEDTKKTQGSELERVGGWGVKLLGCKIALAAVLLFQHFMASCSASVLLACSMPSSLFFCPHHTSAEFGPLSVEDVTLWNTVITVLAALCAWLCGCASLTRASK